MSASLSDREFYEELVRRYSADLYRFAYRLCGEPEGAEDIVQETFYEAWRSIGSLRDREKARAWLYSILRHRYVRWVREQSRRSAEISAREVETMPADSGQNVLEALAQREMLQNALDALPDRYKEAFLLVFQGGLTCQEAADELGIPLGTVLSRIHRARRRLRSHLRALDWERETGAGPSSERTKPGGEKQ